MQTEFDINQPISCDTGRLAQLVSNLLNDALTYRQVASPVLVRANNDAEFFHLSVCNAGEAIPEAALLHLFEPFYRAGPGHNREGLGLGCIWLVRLQKLMERL